METPKKKLKLEFSLKESFSFPVAPVRQFRSLMFISLFVFVAMVGAHMYLFYKIKSKDIFQTAEVQTVSVPTVNEKKLNSVLTRYQAKEAARAAAIQKAPEVLMPNR